MSRSWQQTLLILVVAVLAGLGGAWAGPKLAARANGSDGFHAAVHRDLDLDAQQTARIEDLERDFAIRRKAMELEMRQANAELAAAIKSEQAYGPAVTAAVDHFHVAMGGLQKASIEHVFAMRAVMTPEQTEIFDRTIVDALTAESK